jgi:ABC-type amino acid transport substrate-binding protein
VKCPQPTLVLLLAAAALWGANPAAGETPLKVCMDEDLPPYSVAHGDTGKGFDVELSKALAGHLGRPLAIQWFETKLDEDSSPTLETNALLSDGRCDVVAGYPLVADSLGRPGLKSARLPDFRGAGPSDRRRRVDLGTMTPSRPYQRAPLVLLLAPGVAPRTVTSLGDVADLRFGVEGGTLADVILMLYKDGSLVEHITHYPAGRSAMLQKLDSGEIDATFMSLSRFDAYRQEHPETKIRSSGFNYPVAFNLGYVSLSGNGALLEQINTVLEQMRSSGEIAALAKATGVTYIEPIEPAVSPGISFAQLAQ